MTVFTHLFASFNQYSKGSVMNSEDISRAGIATFKQTALVLAIGASLFLGGCSVNPKPFTPEELVSTNRADKAQAERDMAPITGPITLEEAIARGLKYNLDHRIRIYEQALATGQLEAGRYDMLPRILLDAGYAWRDKDSTRSSEDPAGNIINSQYISTESKHTTADLGFYWNVIDFGVGYYNAKESADRVLIAVERRRRAMHTLIQSVRTAFWRAAAAEKLSEQVRATIKDGEAALQNSRRVLQEQVKSPGDALRFQRNLLENLRLLENVERELAASRIELATLIGATPGTRIQLREPAVSNLDALNTPIEKMEEIALTRNADLREQHYNARIAAIETRRALVKLIPGISFNYIYHYDDDKYLIHNRWADAGFRVSFNLFNLLSAPSRLNAAKLGVSVAEAKRMAMQMSVLTQVHLARHQYDDALRQYQRSDAIYEVDNRLAGLAVSQERSQMGDVLARISANVTSILSDVRRYHAMAKVHEAASKVQATLGLEPEIGSLDEIDLPTLQKQIEETLYHWNLQEGGQNKAPLTAPVASKEERPSHAEAGVASVEDVSLADLAQNPVSEARSSEPAVVANIVPAAAQSLSSLPTQRKKKIVRAKKPVLARVPVHVSLNSGAM